MKTLEEKRINKQKRDTVDFGYLSYNLEKKTPEKRRRGNIRK
jgi:hypothetical protein